MDKLKIEVPYFQSPNKIFEIGLSTNELIVYLYLCRCGNNSTAFPSYKTIGERCSIHRDTAIKTIKKLIDKNLIVKHSRVLSKNVNDSNVYEVVTNLQYYSYDNNDKLERLGLKVAKKQGSRSELPGRVVVDNYQGSRSERLGVVVDNYQGSRSELPNKELTYKELYNKKLYINKADNETSHCDKSDEQVTKSKKNEDIENTFEKLWSLYPLKRGKGSISKSKKTEIFKIGFDRMKTAIETYLKDTELRRKDFPQLNYKNGSTFFNTGYQDYIQDNFTYHKPKQQQVKKPVQATNYEQREYSDEYFESLYSDLKIVD